MAIAHSGRRTRCPRRACVDVGARLRHVQAQTVAAVAACTAAGLSLVNVGYQAYHANRNETRKWRREKLPEAIRSFGSALHKMTRKIMFKSHELHGAST